MKFVKRISFKDTTDIIIQRTSMLIKKDELEELKSSIPTELEIAKAERIQQTKQIYLQHNIDRFEKINESIIDSIKLNRTYSRPLYLQIPYSIKDQVLFDIQAVSEILKDAGYNKVMPMRSYPSGKNREYYTDQDGIAKHIDTSNFGYMDSTYYKIKRYFFFWKPVEVRIYFSLYLG